MFILGFLLGVVCFIIFEVIMYKVLKKKQTQLKLKDHLTKKYDK